MPKQTILNLLPFLSPNDRREIFSSISNQVFDDNFSSLSSQIQEQRYAHGYLECPFCQTHHVVKNGKRGGIQRYLCRECEKSFCTQTQTASAYSKKEPAIWIMYMECFIAGYSLRKCAEVCQINLTTAFYWRHKILEALKSFSKVGQVSGLIEADECFFRFSQKGKRKKEMNKSDSKVKKRGISSDQVAVGTALDRQGNLVF